MRIQKAAIQAAAVKLSARAEECFERADDQHKSAEAQHANADVQQDNADRLEVLGTTLLEDSMKLYGDTEVHPPPAAPNAPVVPCRPLRSKPP
jgi:uncharacterized protein YaeQ